MKLPMTKKRISLWSGPRNVSTALMYSFAQRPDTMVLDEPLYGHYLKVSGAQHPGRDDVINSMELNGETVVLDLCQLDYEKPVLFIKNMAHHLVNLDMSFLKGFHNLLLIRDPKEMIPSIIKQIPNPEMRDTGLKRQWELYNHLKDQGQTSIIIDSKMLLLDPKGILKRVCLALDIPFFEEMTTWEAGPRPEDGIWAKHWYHNVHKSTGFQEYQPKEEKVPEHLHELWEQCDFYYQLLYSQVSD
jgi:hypothetical protein